MSGLPTSGTWVIKVVAMQYKGQVRINVFLLFLLVKGSFEIGKSGNDFSIKNSENTHIVHCNGLRRRDCHVPTCNFCWFLFLNGFWVPFNSWREYSIDQKILQIKDLSSIVRHLDYHSLTFCWLLNDPEERKEVILTRIVYGVLLTSFCHWPYKN